MDRKSGAQRSFEFCKTIKLLERLDPWSLLEIQPESMKAEVNYLIGSQRAFSWDWVYDWLQESQLGG